MRVRGKISLLLEGLSPILAVLKKGLAGSRRPVFPARCFPSPHIAYDLRSNGFGLTCAKFEGAGARPGKINKWRPCFVKSRSW